MNKDQTIRNICSIALDNLRAYYSNNTTLELQKMYDDDYEDVSKIIIDFCASGNGEAMYDAIWALDTTVREAMYDTMVALELAYNAETL